jgi:hypothetical protein
MTDLQGKRPSANDAILNSLGYWTDRGATYYYHYDPSPGYQGTLLAVANSFKHEGIPLGYMQLDSWWYPKGSSDSWQGNGAYRGGIYTYSAAPALFPNGLHAFQHQLGLPLVTHSRWIDTSSPYRKEYAMSNNVSIDPRYWNMIGPYLHNRGAITYEHLTGSLVFLELLLQRSSQLRPGMMEEDTLSGLSNTEQTTDFIRCPSSDVAEEQDHTLTRRQGFNSPIKIHTCFLGKQVFLGDVFPIGRRCCPATCPLVICRPEASRIHGGFT